MFTTRTKAGPTRLTLTRAAYNAYDGNSHFAAEPTLPKYLSDMGKPYGATLRAEATATGHSHAEMAEPLIEALAVGPVPIDVLILAQRMHDVSPGRATATYLASRCPGTPLALSVCDQGTASPFTALRLLAAYAETGACRRALLIVVEQATLPYNLITEAALPDRNTAAAFLLEPGQGAIETRQEQHQQDHQIQDQQPPAQPPPLPGGVPASSLPLSSPQSAMPRTAGDNPTGLWTTNDTEPQDVIVLRDQAGLPLTGLWWQLAAGLDKWAADNKRVVLTDHDPTIGLRSTATFDLTEGTP